MDDLHLNRIEKKIKQIEGDQEYQLTNDQIDGMKKKQEAKDKLLYERKQQLKLRQEKQTRIMKDEQDRVLNHKKKLLKTKSTLNMFHFNEDLSYDINGNIIILNQQNPDKLQLLQSQKSLA